MEISCLCEISDRLMGLLSLEFTAISTKDV